MTRFLKTQIKRETRGIAKFSLLSQNSNVHNLGTGDVYGLNLNIFLLSVIKKACRAAGSS